MRRRLSDGQDCSSTVALCVFSALKPVQLLQQCPQKSRFSALWYHQQNPLLFHLKTLFALEKPQAPVFHDLIVNNPSARLKHAFHIHHQPVKFCQISLYNFAILV